MTLDQYLALTKFGIEIASELLRARTGKEPAALTTEEMEKEIAELRTHIVDAATIFDQAVRGEI